MAFVGVGQGEEGASRSTPPWEVQFLMGMIQQAGWGGRYSDRVTHGNLGSPPKVFDLLCKS